MAGWPPFLRDEESIWPIFNENSITEFPEEKKLFVGIVNAEENTSLTQVVDINRFSKVKLLLMTTARILKLYKRFKTDGIKNDVDVSQLDLKDAERIWITDAQKQLRKETKDGKLKKLNPQVENGIIVVGGRAERWMEATYNNEKFILLPQNHLRPRRRATN